MGDHFFFESGKCDSSPNDEVYFSPSPRLQELQAFRSGLMAGFPNCSLKLLNRQVLLPCDHVFCDSCIHKSSQVELGCPACKSKHPKKARRNLHFMESVISIYKSLIAAVSVHLPQLHNPNDAPNNSNSPKDCISEDSEMIDKDVIKRSGGGNKFILISKFRWKEKLR